MLDDFEFIYYTSLKIYFASGKRALTFHFVSTKNRQVKADLPTSFS